MMQASQKTKKYIILRQLNKYYNTPTTAKPNHHAQRFATTSKSILILNTPTILPMVGKECMCF